MRMLIIMIILLIVFLVMIVLATEWASGSNSMIQGMQEFFENILGTKTIPSMPQPNIK